MPVRSLVLRFFSVLTLAVWVGGFTFYSAVVIPVLHDVLGSLDTGYVTQRVTDFLNVAGVVAVLIWWAAVWAERSLGSARVRRLRLGLLAGTTLLLVVLIVLHRVMDARLDAGNLRGFYPLHRTYLVASTAQWFLNLGLLAGSLVLWWEVPFKSESAQPRRA